jgi:sigma-B regulation protein RsbU (phosphoserine phosphatase)
LGFLEGDWSERLAFIDATMRELSLHDDPQEMVRSYGIRVRRLVPAGGFLSLSRRGLDAPRYRITRSSTWSEDINPWTQKDRLPLLEGGLLGRLIYDGEPRLIDDITPLLTDDDPAIDYLSGFRSLMASPHYDHGVALNMTVNLEREPAAFDPEKFPEWFWLSSLFGRLTNNLVLKEELKRAYEIVERELKVVADIQRSLLPRRLPAIPGLELGAHYQTSQWAGGDYYDFFPLPDGRFGILIADVSGHGTPAAVIMAITHSLAHSLPGHPEPPAALLEHVNHHLYHRYAAGNEGFVTAFYGVYDPSGRSLTYACAGHNPPRMRRCGERSVQALDEIGGPPLGLFDEPEYGETTVTLAPGTVLAFYTDGITEAMNAGGAQFGVNRLDAALGRCDLDAQGIVQAVIEAVDQFSGGRTPEDDRTLLVARVK